MKLKQILQLILLTISFPIFTYGQGDQVKYRGEVECEYVSINDTLRLVCNLISHKDNIDYLIEKEEYQGISEGTFILMDNKYVLWKGSYSTFNSSGLKTETMKFENGVLINE